MNTVTRTEQLRDRIALFKISCGFSFTGVRQSDTLSEAGDICRRG
ncbi:hypothetical protein V7O62_09220 [Methanolobus sp. ZRKC2]